MYCEQCGNNMKEGARFCTSCGTPAKSVAPVVPEVQEIPEAPVVPEVQEIPEVPVVPEVPEVQEIPEIPEVPEVPVTPEVPEIPIVPEVPVTPEVPEVAIVPEMPVVAEAPVAKEHTFCGECGSKMNSTVKFCNDCGSPMPKTQAAQQAHGHQQQQPQHVPHQHTYEHQQANAHKHGEHAHMHQQPQQQANTQYAQAPYVAPSAQALETDSFTGKVEMALSLLVFWMKGFVEITPNDVRMYNPNMILNLIPAGGTEEQIPLRNLGGATVNTSYKIGNFIIGLILLFVGFGMMGESAIGGLIVAVFGAVIGLSGIVTQLTVKGNAGNWRTMDVPFYEKAKVVEAKQKLDAAIAYRENKAEAIALSASQAAAQAASQAAAQQAAQHAAMMEALKNK